MRVLVLDIDQTLFDADEALRDGAADSLAMLHRLGIKLGGISGSDHRVLVRMDEAGIRSFFSDVLCTAHTSNPKSVGALHKMLDTLGVTPQESALVSHAHADIMLGKDANFARTIGISHGSANAAPLALAGADAIIGNIPAILDVLE